jgi:putative DNA primase/helicase
MTTRLQLTPQEREAIEALASLPLVEYDRGRKQVAERLDIRKSTLDKEVAAIRAKLDGGGNSLQGTALKLADPDPWPVPVNGAALLDSVVTVIRRYVALDEHLAEAVALWVVHAHAHDAAEVSPVLVVTSPVHRCGKTQLLQVIGALTPRTLHAANVTAAALFRTVDLFRPTFLLDEGDTYLTSEELRGVLNSGHVRSTATIVRTVGDEHEPREFSVWAAKAIAKIGQLAGRWTTLADRSIEIPMRRRSPEEKIEDLRLDRLHKGLGPLCRQAWRWSRDNHDALRKSDPVIPDPLHDRAADNARPLLAIADLAGGEWPERARVALLAIYGMQDQGDDDWSIQLLADIRELFTELDRERIASIDLVNKLLELEDRPWPDWGRGRGLTVSSLARLLKRFGIKPRKMRLPGWEKPVRGYARNDFESSWRRYLDSQLVTEVEHTEHRRQFGEDFDSATRNAASNVPLWESRESSGDLGFVPVVPGQNSILAEEEL